MKKLVMFVAVATMVAFASCGNKSEKAPATEEVAPVAAEEVAVEEVVADSTAAVADSAAVVEETVVAEEVVAE